ncbi:MAG: hypothetical protein ALECFALPRED_005866 [Alectoria fallacina]|uniref:Nucleolar complex-associated protein 3 n=1 Tax=Alectoria fallacina TaxID=1903189 RepID=A0A8H3IUI1_9LECA|nr:MAG: hypothetical protein ALECFALPRED_005866 [Alectoria fallacina]
MTVVPAVKRRKLSPPESSDPDSSASTLVGQSSAQDDFFNRAAGWNLEQDYEQRPRKQKKKEKESTRLPIKTAEGRIEQVQVPEVVPEDDDSWLGSEKESIEEPAPVQEETKVPIRQQILEAQEELARIASLVNEDPEEHAGAFRTLAQIAASPNFTIKKLGLATQLAVYKDVIPGYRIRPIAEIDQTEKVSKDVRRLRAFEQSLISSYQAYIKDLAKCAKARLGGVSEAALNVKQLAIACTCALLIAVPHFNFRGELLKILVGKLSTNKIDADFIKCRETMEILFRMDEDGTSSLDAVGLITRMMKARNYQIDESVLNTFLHLRLLSEFSSKASPNRVDKAPTDHDYGGKKPKFKKEFRTKKQRKIMKERKVVEKEFKEADATVSHEQRDRMQGETLKLVFVTYLRILNAGLPHLMGAVLQGLANYAHLINQDLFGILLEALKGLMSDAEALLTADENEQPEEEGSSESNRDSTRESLLCISTAFALLEGQDVARSASSLNLDLTDFTAHLYNILHSFCINPDLELSHKSLRLPDPHAPSPAWPTTTAPTVNIQTTTVLMLRALTSILTSRSVPPVRLGAFTKKLFTSTLQLPEKSTLAMVSLLINVTKIHGRKIAALWNTEERKGDGVFDAMRGDMEGSNPFASTIWDGELLRLHYAPAVREGIRGIERVIGDVK